MDDRQLWELGFTRLEGLLEGLPAETMRKFERNLHEYHQAKEILAAVAGSAGAASACSECRGQCCLNGKYRVNVLDAAALMIGRLPVPADFSRKPDCPYGSDDGCTMEPGLRPADCIVFICDAIDAALPEQDRSLWAAQEQKLRGCIEQASRLTGERLGIPLLLWAERAGTHPY